MRDEEKDELLGLIASEIAIEFPDGWAGVAYDKAQLVLLAIEKAGFVIVPAASEFAA